MLIKREVSGRGRQLNDEDVTLFRRAVGPVIPLPQQKIAPTHPLPSPYPHQTRRDQQNVLIESLSSLPNAFDAQTGDELAFIRPGLQHKLLRKLRRGHFSVGAELDLHGMTVPVAQFELSGFLRKARAQSVRCVRIIHGKGLRSHQGRPVLKLNLDRWLRLRDEVIAFTSARPVDGGTGAVYVLLKR
ncbi:MAG: Smr/MutS family protein [Gammaproteobacteria bacterium]